MPAHDLGPPVDRGRRRLHARRPAPRPVERASADAALAAAVTWGAAAVTLPGSRVPTPEIRAGIPDLEGHPSRDPSTHSLLLQLTPKGSTMPLITDEQVVLDLTGADRHEATRTLAERLVASGRCTDLDTFLADVSERQQCGTTWYQPQGSEYVVINPPY